MGDIPLYIAIPSIYDTGIAEVTILTILTVLLRNAMLLIKELFEVKHLSYPLHSYHIVDIGLCPMRLYMCCIHRLVYTQKLLYRVVCY